jgi:hypothetical protein
MSELKDYSGKFKPDLKYEDFSKHFLVKMIKEYSAAYMRLDKIWFKTVEEVLGDEKTNKLNIKVWDEVAKQSVKRFATAANIQIKDVVDVMKAWQMCVDGSLGGMFPVAYDIKSTNHVILTITRCEILEQNEQNDPRRIELICHELEQKAMKSYFNCFLPDVQVKPLKLPPSGGRKSPDEVACIWEYKYEPKT